MGLRVSENTEIVGLDKCEHGLSSSCADLLNTAQFITAAADEPSKVRAIDLASELNAWLQGGRKDAQGGRSYERRKVRDAEKCFG